MKRVCLLVLAVLCGVLVLSAQQQNSNVKMNPAKPTSAASGEQMYMNYCASCHGRDGKGDGPAAAGLQKHPADLTKLSQSHGGTFPSQYVINVLQGKVEVTPHGSREMPVWGPIFRAVSGGHEGEVQLRINNLAGYLKSLQK